MTDTQMTTCPYHAHWIRLGWSYRACPKCSYCVRSAILRKRLGLPGEEPRAHVHNVYSFTEQELAEVAS